MSNPKFLRYGPASAALADGSRRAVTVERGDRIAVTSPLPLDGLVLSGALAAPANPAKVREGVMAHR